MEKKKKNIPNTTIKTTMSSIKVKADFLCMVVAPYKQNAETRA